MIEGWSEIRRALIKVSRIWQYETYGPLIGPKTPEQIRNTYEGVHRGHAGGIQRSPHSGVVLGAPVHGHPLRGHRGSVD